MSPIPNACCHPPQHARLMKIFWCGCLPFTCLIRSYRLWRGMVSYACSYQLIWWGIAPSMLLFPMQTRHSAQHQSCLAGHLEQTQEPSRHFETVGNRLVIVSLVSNQHTVPRHEVDDAKVTSPEHSLPMESMVAVFPSWINVYYSILGYACTVLWLSKLYVSSAKKENVQFGVSSLLSDRSLTQDQFEKGNSKWVWPFSFKRVVCSDQIGRASCRERV